MAGSVNDWRFDPFTESYNAVLVSDEDRDVPGSSPYQVRLYEVPRKDSPSTVSCVILVELDEELDDTETAVDILAAHYGRVQVGDVLLCDDEQMYVSEKPGSPTLNVTRAYGGTSADTHTDGTMMEILDSMTEITSGSPATREFRVDYKYSTGLVLFNSAEGGYDVRFDYYGLGSPFHEKQLGVMNPVVLAPADFVPNDDTTDFTVDEIALLNRTSTNPLNQCFYAGVHLPERAKITKITFCYYRNGISAMVCDLLRSDRGSTGQNMASITASKTGWTSEDETAINYDTIDNENYSYTVEVQLNPITVVSDAQLSGVLIYWEWS